MKRIISIFLFLVTLCLFCACGGEAHAKKYTLYLMSDAKLSQFLCDEYDLSYEFFRTEGNFFTNKSAKQTVTKQILGQEYELRYEKSSLFSGVIVAHDYIGQDALGKEFTVTLDAETATILSYRISYATSAETEEEYLEMIQNEIPHDVDLSRYEKQFDVSDSSYSYEFLDTGFNYPIYQLLYISDNMYYYNLSSIREHSVFEKMVADIESIKTDAQEYLLSNIAPRFEVLQIDDGEIIQLFVRDGVPYIKIRYLVTVNNGDYVADEYVIVKYTG